MLTALANRNPDIDRLLKKGYALSYDSGYLIVHDIPYLDGNALKLGAFVTKLVFVDETLVRQENHQVFMAGTSPCSVAGQPIPYLGETNATLTLQSPDERVERIFSNKPADGFPDFFSKIEHYVSLICGPAITLYPDASPLTFKSIFEHSDSSPFIFQDTLTSRAEIGDLTQKLKDDVILIIGLGGTGAFILDSIVRCPVKKIIGFDGDIFQVHNAYRSPGRLDRAELGKKKAQVYQARYEGFRRDIELHPQYFDSTSIELVSQATFAFVCVDKGSARKEIFELLIALKIPFIDVGMGLDRARGPLSGTIRATYFDALNASALVQRRFAETADHPDDEYRQNVQIGELNALNAALAVMKYKKVRGFYFDGPPWVNLLFEVGEMKMFNEV